MEAKTLLPALSKIGMNSLNDTSTVLDLGEIAKAQEEDPELHNMRSAPSLIFKDIPLPLSNSTIVCDTSTGVPRPFVPSKFRHAVLIPFIHYLTQEFEPHSD